VLSKLRFWIKSLKSRLVMEDIPAFWNMTRDEYLTETARL